MSIRFIPKIKPKFSIKSNNLTFAVFLTQFSFDRACYAKMDFWVIGVGSMISINGSLTHNIIGPGHKDHASYNNTHWVNGMVRALQLTKEATGHKYTLTE